MSTSSGARRPDARRPRPSGGAGSSRAVDAPGEPAAGPGERFGRFLERIDHPLATYHLLLTCTGALLGLGLVMVLSATATRSYGVFLRQAEYAVIGVVLATIASRVPIAAWRRFSGIGYLLALLLQGLVLTPLGVEVQGNRGWVRIAGQQLQPSEFAKLALVVYGGFLLERAVRRKGGSVREILVPFVAPAALLLLGLQLYGNDLGTGLVLIMIVAGMLFAAGLELKWFAAAGALAVVAVLAMTATSSNRTNRISAWLGDACVTNEDLCRQVDNGFYALADGGWWGVGLGQSRQKWGWLPESGNDFILAIIGEELGLPGTLAVLLLYGLLAYACLRLVLRSREMFVRLAAAGVMVWILVQATINIGAVTGLLPVIGVPLPLISGGGTALISTLMALGMLIGFARREPGAQAELAVRRHSRPRRTPARRPATGATTGTGREHAVPPRTRRSTR